MRNFCENILWRLASVLLGLTGCMQPVDGDFGEERLGLNDRELLWVVQLTADAPGNDSAEAAFFQRAVPQIARAVLDGKLTAYDDFALGTSVPATNNVAERLTQFGGSRQNISPLTQLVELIYRVDLDAAPGSGKLVFVRLIWRDQDGQQADRSLAGIRPSDLQKQDFTLWESNDAPSVSSWLAEGNFNFQPVYLRTNVREYTLQSPAEAAYVKDFVQNGKWDAIEWLENGINISGKQKQSLPPEKVLEFNGLYQFPQTDSTKTARQLFLTAEKDYLIADWSERFRMEKLMAFDSTSFFSTAGELYLFSKDDSENLRLEVLQNNDTLYGEREIAQQN